MSGLSGQPTTSNITSPMSLTKSKFDLRNPRKNLQIVEDNFFKWSNDHMYRTSTHDMQDKTYLERKNHAIPGYQGFVPGF